MNEAISKKKLNLAVLVEFILSAGLGIYFHWVLHYEHEAYVIFGIGLLLSLSTYLINEKIGHSDEILLNNYKQSHQINFSLNQIKDSECWTKAQEILGSTNKTFDLLRQGYIPLKEMEFYFEGVKSLSQSKRQVKAVDPLTIGWNNRGALLNYYQANLDAIKRGVKITRIFVLSKRDLADLSVQRVIQTQLGDNIDVRIAYLEELAFRNDFHIFTNNNCPFDFAIFDNKIVTERSGLSEKYLGKKTSSPVEVKKYLSLFELIEHHARPAASEDNFKQKNSIVNTRDEVVLKTRANYKQAQKQASPVFETIHQIRQALIL